jgi:hypothetical protein
LNSYCFQEALRKMALKKGLFFTDMILQAKRYAYSVHLVSYTSLNAFAKGLHAGSTVWKGTSCASS